MVLWKRPDLAVWALCCAVAAFAPGCDDGESNPSPADSGMTDGGGAGGMGGGAGGMGGGAGGMGGMGGGMGGMGGEGGGMDDACMTACTTLADCAAGDDYCPGIDPGESRDALYAGCLESCADMAALATIVNNLGGDCAQVVPTVSGASADFAASCEGAGGAGGMGGEGGMGGDGGMGGEGGMGGMGGAMVPNDCEGYCDLMEESCPGTYAARETCLSTCALFPAEAEVGATDGNSLQCRIYHAGVAAQMDAEVHCPHAGPEGGDVCGSYCDVYCDLVETTCVGDSALYEDRDSCMTACAEFPTDGEVGAVDGDSVQCRIYHGGVPADADPATHCPHAGADGGGVCEDAAPNDCEGYCDLMDETCPGVYPARETCLATCALFPADGEVGDTDGNTLQCRIYHAGVAGDMDPELHCPHAGPEGGDVCGSYCDVYCDLVENTCQGDDAIYDDRDSCLAACAEFPTDGDVGALDGDSVQCRIYHGGVPAAADPALHCPHAGADGAMMCAAPPPPVNEEPDSPEAPYQLEFNAQGVAAVVFELEPAGDQDWFTFTLAEPALVSLKTNRPDDVAACNGDTILTLLDATGENQLGRNDDGGGAGLCSFIPPTPLPAGDYLVRAEGFGGRAAGPNLLTARIVDGAPIGDRCGPDFPPCEATGYCAEPAEGDADGVCTAHECGDGIQAPDEQCDDGNMDAGDGCEMCAIVGIAIGNACDVGGLPCADDAFCDAREGEGACAPIVCGDGSVNGDEACDDGNEDAGDGCEACQIVGIPVGNACEAGGFACAEGAFCDDREGDGACAAIVCGDGSVNGDEACDDGNDEAGDGCEACQIVAIPEGNACDPAGVPCALGSFCDDSGEAPVCAPNVCGDDNRQNDEECDDGNLEAGDGCDAECMVEVDAERNAEPDSVEAPFALQFDENGHAEALYMNSPEADVDYFSFVLEGPRDVTIYQHAWDNEAACAGDPNIRLWLNGEEVEFNDDGGPGLCGQIVRSLEAGEYIIEAGTFRDRIAGPNFINVDVVEIVAAGGACDDENAAQRCADGLQCLANVCAEPECGDGLPGPGEACDDGNDDEEDGCTSACEIAPVAEGNSCNPETLGFEAPCAEGLYCDLILLERNKGVAGTCVAHRCGDTVLGPDEQCDDGNQDEGDGCDAQCQINPTNADAEPDSAEMPYQLDLADGMDMVAFAIDPREDEDFFGFSIPNDSKVRIWTGTLDGGCAGDTFIELWAAGAEAPLATDDDGGAGTCSQLDPIADEAMAPLAAGDYVVKVRPFSPRLIGLQFIWVQVIPEIGVGDGCDAEDPFSFCVEGSYCAEDSTCTAHVCGDGVVGPEETCDDANEVDGDGCDACALAPIMEGMACPVAGTECAEGTYCAEGEGEEPGACTAHECGDGIVGPEEECDGGENCAEDCTFLSQLIEGPGAFEGGFPEDGSDVYTFSLDAPTQVLAFTGDGEGGCPGDTILTLFDADANEQIARNDDDAAIRPCSQIEEILEAGNYRIEVSGFGGRGIEAYTLGVVYTPVLGDNEICDRAGIENVCAAGLICAIVDGDGQGLCAPPAASVDEAEPNQTTADATVVPVPGVANGSIGDGGADVDVFAITLEAATEVTVYTSNGGAGCTGDQFLRHIDGAILDANGVDASGDYTLASNDDGGPGFCGQLTLELDAGTHYFMNEDLSRNSEVAGYVFHVEIPVAPAEAGEICDTEGQQVQCADGLGCFDDNQDRDGVCAAEMAAMAGANASMGFGAGGFDLWSFEVDSMQRVTLSTAMDEADCGDNDTRLYLYRVTEDGPDELTSNDDANEDDLGFCSRVSEVLMPGRYVVKVDGFGNGAVGEYSFYWMGPEMAGEGEACDRTGVESRCMDGLGCMPGMEAGIGACMPMMAMAMDVEPDASTGDVAGALITMNAAADSTLAGDDDFDVFGISLDGEAQVRAWTGDGEGGCPGDTVMHRVDGAVLDADGYQGAVDGAFETGDDTGVGLCSELAGTLAAGEHYFIVRPFGAAVDNYVFSVRIRPVLADGAMCDAAGVYNVCGEGLDCMDDDQDNDGMCMAPPMVP